MRNDIVLIVQPDADSREIYAEYFRYRGLHPIPVATARHALALAPRVHLIVAGLLLPRYLDGIAMIERLKTDRQTRDIPLIVVTCCAWTTERAGAEQAGCDLFLSKPCVPDHLTREVRRLLAASVANQTRRRSAGQRTSDAETMGVVRSRSQRSRSEHQTRSRLSSTYATAASSVDSLG